MIDLKDSETVNQGCRFAEEVERFNFPFSHQPERIKHLVPKTHPAFIPIDEAWLFIKHYGCRHS